MPDLSVVIPTYNGAGRLLRCLEHLHAQTLPPSCFETIVVVDGSTDHTLTLLAGFKANFWLRVIQQNNRGAGASRNAGVAVAQSAYCLFLDDDVVADPRLLAEHLRVHSSQEGVVGLGAIPTVAPGDAAWLSRRFVEGWNAHYAKLAKGTQPPSWWDCYGGNMSISRSAFLSVGGFDTDMRRGHDVELGYRLFQHGLSFVHIPTAIGTQELGKGLRELVSDFENYGVAAGEIYRRHPETLPKLSRDFRPSGIGPLWVRRLAVATGIPAHVLGAVRPFAGREKWFHFIQNYCYWRGVRRRLNDPQMWWQLMHPTPIRSQRVVETDRIGSQAEAVTTAASRRSTKAPTTTQPW